MRAVGVAEKDGRAVVEVRDVPEPEYGPEDLLVRVRAAGILRPYSLAYQLGQGADLSSGISAIAGRMVKPPKEFTPLGREFAGEVVAVGSRVPPRSGRPITTMNPPEEFIGFNPGDRVMAHVGGSNGKAIGAPDGGQADLAVVHHRLASRVPDSISWTDAGAISYAYTIATDALVQSDLMCGERILVHAVSGAIGSAVVQMAKVMGASLIIGTAGSAEKLEKAKELGLDVGVNYHKQDFADVVAEATDGWGVDVIIDHIGAPYWDQHLRSLALKGRLIHLQSGLAALDHHVKDLDLQALGGKRQTVRGSVIGSLPMEERVMTVRRFERIALPHLASGRIRAVVDRVYSFDQAAEAYDYVASAANRFSPDAMSPLFGKVVLVPDPES